MNETKRCSKCGETKEYSEFYIRNKNSRRQGAVAYTSMCRKCNTVYIRQRREIKENRKIKPRDELLKCICVVCGVETYNTVKKRTCSDSCRQMDWKTRYPEKRKAIEHRRRIKRTNEKAALIVLYDKIYIKRCKDCGDVFTAKSKTRQFCSDRCRINNSKRNRYANNIDYKILVLLRGRLLSAVKTQRTYKCSNTIDLVGCSKEELKTHLASLFYERESGEKMSLEKFGMNGIHIDHIRPCTSFDLTDPEQQKQCFHYTNLQPLWAEDNLRKSDKWGGE